MGPGLTQMEVLAPDYDLQAPESKAPGRGRAEFEGHGTSMCSSHARFSTIPDVNVRGQDAGWAMAGYLWHLPSLL